MFSIAEITAGEPMGLADGLSQFGSLVTALMSAWQSIITKIVTAGNWILILPVFAYIFVVATASLRSFYKG